MNPSQIDALIIGPALSLLPERMDTPEARRMLTVIALQESDGLRARRQYGGGPARGWWQCELGGPPTLLLEHHATQAHVRDVCATLVVEPTPSAIYAALEYGDLLSACLARLNLWWLPYPMASTEDEGFSQYIEAWRPGAYTRGDARQRAAIKQKFVRYFRETLLRRI